MRELAGSTEISEERFHFLVHFLDAVAIAAIDIECGMHPVQLSLSGHANRCFQGIRDRVRLGTNPEHETVDPDTGGANHTDSGPKGQIAP